MKVQRTRYLPVTRSYPAKRNDGYDVFKTITDKEDDMGIVDTPTFIQNAQMLGTFTAPPLTENYSTQKITPKGDAVTGSCATVATATSTNAPMMKTTLPLVAPTIK
jgi:hypothetical protein